MGEDIPKVAILSAGVIGSGLANVLVEAGWGVNLWGAWLDDHLIDTIGEGRPRPCINVVASGKIRPFRSVGLKNALDGVDVVAISVASQGTPEVTEMTLPGIAKAEALWLTSKGFMPVNGKILLLPNGVRSIVKAADIELPPVIAVAGPVKANECAADEPITTIFGCKSRDVAVELAYAARLEHHCIEATDDEVSVEICASMKNVYAIMLGIVDGLEEKTDKSHCNLKAMTFNGAVRGMSVLSTALGADPATTYGLPGAGNLEATGLSGRNEVYGMCIGRGEGVRDALQVVTELEQTVEDMSALPLAISLVEQPVPRIKDRLPLPYVARQIVEGDVPDYAAVPTRAILPPKP